MQPPPELSRALNRYDQGLRLRWSEALDLFCLERRHGFAGRNPGLILDVLFQHWKQLEEESAGAPDDMELETEERLAYDIFLSRHEGYQPILYLNGDAVRSEKLVMDTLLRMDIRAAGGPVAYVRRMKAEQEATAERARKISRDKVREVAEEYFDKASAQKDFHAQGGDAWLYRWDKDDKGRAKW